MLRLQHHRDGKVDVIAEAPFEGPAVRLKIAGDYLDLSFRYAAGDSQWKTLAADVDGSVLSPESIGGFNYTGTYVGLYGSSNGHETSGHARYSYFNYRPTTGDATGWFRKERSK